MDDEKDILEAFRHILERKGFEVLTALDGAEAIRLVEKEPFPDLIVLDVQMPDMNGYTFMFELYREEKRRNIPVIVVSAFSEMQPIFAHRGIKDYVVKPVNPDELIEKIKKFVNV